MKDTFSPYKIFSPLFGHYWTLIIGPPSIYYYVCFEDDDDERHKGRRRGRGGQ